MKQFALLIMSMMIFLSACSPASPSEPVSPAASPLPGQTTTATQTPVSTNGPVAQPAGADAVQEAVIQQLAANLELDPAQITVVSDTPTEFPDSCLGVSMPDVMCAQMVTAGRIIVLKAGGMEYEYHTTRDGSVIQPASLALTWKREGGIAGMCDSLVIFRSGEIFANRCKPASEGRMRSMASMFSEAERAQLQEWLSKFGQLNIDASDPKGVADRMIVTLLFQGTGDQQTMTAAEQQTLLEFVQALDQRIFSDTQ